MTLQSAAETLNSDLQAVQARMASMGWPTRARVIGTGVSGPSGRGTGVYVRLDADGEAYVFTLTGNAMAIERLITLSHQATARALAQAEWPSYMNVREGARAFMEDHADSQESAPAEERVIVPDTISGYDAQELDPRPRRSLNRETLSHHTFQIQRRPDGMWTAGISIPVQGGGSLYLCATADEHAVAQALHGELSDLSGGRSWAGSESYRAACGAVAEARAIDRVGLSFQSFIRDPGVASVFSSIVPLVPVVGPVASMAYQGTRMALDVVDKANAGDPKARQGITAVVDQAKKGDKKALIALKALKLAQDIRKGAAPMPPKPMDPPKNDPRDAKIKSLEAERDSLRAKIEECNAKWAEKPLEAADDFMDMWGGGDEFVGPDVIQAAGSVMGAYANEVGAGSVARPMLAGYFRSRLPVGHVDRLCSPEVGALYHRPMRESADASLRRDYLRGTALQRAGFPAGRHFLEWRNPPAAAPVTGYDVGDAISMKMRPPSTMTRRIRHQRLGSTMKAAPPPAQGSRLGSSPIQRQSTGYEGEPHSRPTLASTPRVESARRR